MGLASSGGVGVDGELVFVWGGFGELVEEGEDLVGWLAFEVGEEVEGLLDDGLEQRIRLWIRDGLHGFGRIFSWMGLGSADLLLWLGRSRILVDSFVKFGNGFVGFLPGFLFGFLPGFLRGFDVVLVEVGLRFSFCSASVDGVDGAAGLANEGEHFGVAGVAGFDVLGDREVFADDFHEVDAGDALGLLAQQVELFEQEVVGGRPGDLGPMGFDQLEVGADGGVGDVELFSDLALGEAFHAEVVDFEAAPASAGRDVHGKAPYRGQTYVLITVQNVSSVWLCCG